MKQVLTVLAGALMIGSMGLVGGCSETVSHKETDKPNWSGGRTHEEETTVRNPDGSYTTEKAKTKTSN